MTGSRPQPCDRETLNSVIDLWKGKRDSAEELGGRNGLFYEFWGFDRPCILRFISSTRWKQSEVEAELEWVQHLRKGGARVSGPLGSANGKLVEEISLPGNGDCLASAFEKAPGKGINFHNSDEFSPPLFRAWGEVAGKIHALSKGFLATPGRQRPHFDGEAFVAHVTRTIPKSEHHIVDSIEACWKKLCTLPRSRESFGMIHGDLSSGNFMVDDGRVTVFDFDSCCYGWFAYEIAITLYFTFYGLHLKKAPTADAQLFFTEFMTGYDRSNQLAELWFEVLSDLIAFFNITVYAAYFTSDWDNPDLLTFVKSIIENSGPYTGLDFSSLYKDTQ